jgi:RNA polymerase sigma-70 factor, ECF subfamily
MLLHESRRAARTSAQGDLIVLEEQDRSLWNRGLANEATLLVRQAAATGRIGFYTIQAAIAATHGAAPTVAATNWNQIIGYYDMLAQITPSPVVELNRAVAIAMRDGPVAGLALIDTILARGELANYYLLYAAKADLYRRLGQTAEARSAYQLAFGLTQQDSERRFLERRLHDLGE